MWTLWERRRRDRGIEKLRRNSAFFSPTSRPEKPPLNGTFAEEPYKILLSSGLIDCPYSDSSMEDDDEFGDLYTDVLSTFPSSVSAEQPPPSATSPRSNSATESLNRKDDHEEEACEGPDPGFSSYSNHVIESLVSGPPASSCAFGRNPGDVNKLIDGEVGKNDDLAVVFENWAPDSPKKTESMVIENGDEERNEAREDGDVGDKDEGDDGGEVPEKESHGCDAQHGDTGTAVSGLEPVIPGILIHEAADGVENVADVICPPREDASAEGDDWDSDSDDDLQIVLNDNAQGPLTMDRVDDEDEDGEPLVIVADDDPNHQQMEEQEWGDDAVQSADAERKDAGEAGKVNGKPATAPKIGYSSHGYHPFHSQFKYVRPGAGPLPGTVSGGPAGGAIPVRPPGTTSCRGRGDWRPTGNKAVPSMQEKFQPGYGMPWSSNAQGRGFGGGLEFTLPSHKTIFEVSIDDFDEKPWKLPGVDISDFFNFGLNEDSWKGYCKQLEQLRLEATMQSKIRVYESGRTQHDYDPDLPPELAAAAGIHDITSENAITVKQDIGLVDPSNGSSHGRPPLPTGRPIPVEIGYADRLPSIDTRPPRIRDSDAIIEIVLQDSVDDDPCAGNDISEQPANDTQKEDFIAVKDQKAHTDFEYNDESSLADNRRKRELAAKKVPYMNTAHNDRLEGNGDGPGILSEERPTNGKACDGSPLKSPSLRSHDTSSPGKENEVSVESIGDKQLSLITERRDDQRVSETDENISTHLKRVEMNSDIVDASSTLEGEDLLHPVKKQKLTSQAEQPVLLENAGADDAKAASSENNKSKLESNRRLDAKEQAIGDRHSTRVGNVKRQLIADGPNIRRNERKVKQGNERHHVTVKGREESHSKSTHTHSRRIGAEDATKREHGHEMGSRHKGKLRESERSDGVEHSRKPVDSSSWRGHCKVKDDGSKNHCDNSSDPHNKRRKDEEYPRRDSADKEEALHGHRESTNRRKRDREEITDQRKKDDQARLTENSDDHRSVRHKDEGRFQREKRDRERDEWHRAKQSNEANLSRREREEGQGGVRSARGGEEKSRCGTHARAKDDFSGSDKDYSMKDTGRHGEQPKKRDMHPRGSQFSSEDRRSRQERSITRDDRVDKQSTQEKKRKDSARKRKETESGGQNSSVHTQGGREANHAMVSSGKQNNPQPSGTGNRKEAASSDDEPRNSRRGRSKLERWTSHKERDHDMNPKPPSSSSKPKETDSSNNEKHPEESAKEAEAVGHPLPITVEQQEAGSVDPKPAEGQHYLDTAAKLKKRSERFKLPMPIEKDPVAIKKMESEALPLQVQCDVAAADTGIKPERPARKRRWVNE